MDAALAWGGVRFFGSFLAQDDMVAGGGFGDVGDLGRICGLWALVLMGVDRSVLPPVGGLALGGLERGR